MHKRHNPKEQYCTIQRRGKKYDTKVDQEEEITTWFYTGTTTHREGNKGSDRTSVHRRNENGGTKNVHGRGIRACHMHGYTYARSIGAITGPKEEKRGTSKWLRKEGQGPQETNGNIIDGR